MKFIFRIVGLVMSCDGRFPKSAAAIFVLLSFLFLQSLNAQQWLDNIRKGNRDFYSIQKSFYKYHDSIEAVKTDKRDPDEKEEEEEEEDEGEFSKFKRWEWFMQPRVFPSGDITLPSKTWEEYRKYLDSRSSNLQPGQRINSTQ